MTHMTGLSKVWYDHIHTVPRARFHTCSYKFRMQEAPYLAVSRATNEGMARGAHIVATHCNYTVQSTGPHLHPLCNICTLALLSSLCQQEHDHARCHSRLLGECPRPDATPVCLSDRARPQLALVRGDAAKNTNFTSCGCRTQARTL